MLSYLHLLRPHQWVKSFFVLIPALLSMGPRPSAVSLLLLFLAFSLGSSSVYVLNDILDRERDRAHSRKKHRPIAAGTVSLPEAYALGLTLAAISLALGFSLSTLVGGSLLAYFALNIAYSFHLKHLPLIDALCISLGFSLRLLSGGPGLGLVLSPWILLATFFGTLGMALAKRRLELLKMGAGSHSRPALSGLSLPLLDSLMSIFFSAALGFIGAWIALSPRSIIIVSVPFLTLLLLRFFWMLHSQQEGEDYAKSLLRDPYSLVAAGMFALIAFLTFG